ncbi:MULTISPECIES: SHOCT domain-containing protein [unclassified Roseovarius]|uniref:SHOCT domain-containing protein n=1 Tax=unclassified Roseovarius TaxID=2614913 RepID=UPI00273D85EF|nr:MULTISPECIES: SHOCT domain-containing protein [unclassified Roseovarius]
MGAGTMILFWVFVIVLVIAAVRWLSQQGHRMDNDDKSALRTLEERLAKGEIDVAEFEDRKKALMF